MSTFKILGIDIPILSFNKNQRQMKNEKLTRILGREVQVGEKLSDADMQLILAAVPDSDGGTPPTTPPEKVETPEKPKNDAGDSDEPKESNASVLAAIGDLTSTVKGISDKMSGFESRMEVLEGKKPAASEAAIVPNNPAANSGGEKKYSWEDPESPLNKQIDSDLGPIGK